MRKLHLDKLSEGLPGISPVYGAFLAEAAAVCLVTMGHRSGVRLKVRGDFEEDFLVEWALEIGEEESITWSDLRELVEYGAIALSMLLLLKLTGYCQFQKKEQGAGYDYLVWNFEHEQDKEMKTVDFAAVEVSGIMQENPWQHIRLTDFQEKKTSFKVVKKHDYIYCCS